MYGHIYSYEGVLPQCQLQGVSILSYVYENFISTELVYHTMHIKLLPTYTDTHTGPTSINFK